MPTDNASTGSSFGLTSFGVRREATLANWGTAVLLLFAASGSPALGASPNDPLYAEWQWNLLPDPVPAGQLEGIPNPASINVEPAWQVAASRPSLDSVVVAVLRSGHRDTSAMKAPSFRALAIVFGTPLAITDTCSEHDRQISWPIGDR